MPLNNQVAQFETSSDITEYLQEQWSGLFHHLLQDATRQKEVKLIDDLRATAKTLGQLVTFLTEERRAGDDTIKDILLSNHPMFEAIRSNIDIPYRVFFTNREELNLLLKARQYIEIEKYSDLYEKWANSQMEPTRILKIASEVFDKKRKLNIYTPDEWKSEWVTSFEMKAEEENFFFNDDDPPF